MNLHNKVIAITGAARGLGFSMAEKLAAKGAKLALIDRDPDSINSAAAKLDNAQPYVADVTDEAGVEALFEQIVSDFSQLDGLINNAGITNDGLMIKWDRDRDLLEKMSLQQWQSVVDVNLTGVFLCGREAAAHMAKLGKGGVIVNISSISRAGNFGQTNYSATKAAVVAMTVNWAKELARYKIRTGAVAPGFIETEMTAKMPAAVQEKTVAAVPLKRMGQASEIADTVVFIFENDYFTGRVIEVDGGARI